MGNKENDLLYGGGGEGGGGGGGGRGKELCVSFFDLIDGVGLHAQIRHCWLGLRGSERSCRELEGGG